MSTTRFQFESLRFLARITGAVSAASFIAACGASSGGAPGSGGTSTAAAGSSVGGSSSAGAGAGGSATSVAGAAGAVVVGGGGTANSGGCNQPTLATTTACNGQYPATSIAALRGGKAGGCFELSHVGLVARTDSPTEPRLYLQDPGGADFSAIMAKCAATATHLCAPAVKAKIPQLLDTLVDGAQLSVRGFYQLGAVSGFEEFYVEDIIDECKATPRPAPIPLSVADITRDARSPAKWFRRATVDVPVADPLVVYDFSPAELLLGQPQCPDYAGFAMIQHSAGATVPAACAGQANPAARSTVDPTEVLIGRQFFNQFLFAADCACAGTSNLRIVSPTGSVSGPVLGYLILEQQKGAVISYQIFEPAADKSFPIQ